MTKVAVLADIHLRGGHDTLEAKALMLAADIIIKEECQLVVLAGDIFDAKATPEQEAVLACFVEDMKLTSHCDVILLRGNHDELGQLKALADFADAAVIHSPRSRVIAVESPQTLMASGGGVTLHCIPHHNAGAVAAMSESLDHHNETGTHAFSALLEGIRQQVATTPGHHMVVFHGVVGGAMLDNGSIPKHNGIHLPLGDLVAMGCPVVGGHYHRHQNVAAENGFPGKHVWYPGSIARNTYGEGDVDKGFMIFETGEGTEWLEPRFVSLNPPKMVTLNAAFAGGQWYWLEDGERIPFALRPLVGEMCAGAMVRFRYKFDQDQRGQINLNPIKELFAHALDLKIEGNCIMPTAIRCETVARATCPAEAVKEWGVSRGDAPEKIQAAQEEYKRLYAEISDAVPNSTDTSPTGLEGAADTPSGLLFELTPEPQPAQEELASVY